MRYITSTIAACTLAGAVGVFAQEQAPAQPPAQAQAPKSTLTGCVAQAKTTDGGSVYVLSKVEGGSAEMYVLGGSSQSDFVGEREQEGRSDRAGAGTGQRRQGQPARFESRASAGDHRRIRESRGSELHVARWTLPHVRVGQSICGAAFLTDDSGAGLR